jgi:hypothetical protein
MHTSWTFIVAGMLLGLAEVAAAQGLDIDRCPGLAGQPGARRDLVTEYIRIPSAAKPAGTPSELNQTNFLRVRLRSANPRHVDAILIQAIPNGASSYSESAAQIVEMAARRGKNFEVWGVERREKNLQDMVGLRQAYAGRDPTLALRYYYGKNFLDGSGKFAGTLGGAGASFRELQPKDVPFMADWDAEVLYRDVESMLDLIAPAQRATNVFLYSASPGGEFPSQFAGFRLRDGRRGYQELAGLIAIEGQLGRDTIGRGQPTAVDVAAYVEQVRKIRAGQIPRFIDDPSRHSLLSPGASVAIPAAISLMAADFSPDRESIFRLPGDAAGGPRADAFNARLRLTNLARAGYALSDDPLPGSFTTTFFMNFFGAGLGRVDFTPRPGAPACAQPGPLGMRPPCVPSIEQIDPSRVYGWLEGGPGGVAANNNPLEGWSITPDGAYTNSYIFGEATQRNGPDPTRLAAAVQVFGRPATLTNAVPLTIAFPTGSRTIDSSFNVGWAWYPSNRYLAIDLPFLNRFRRVLVNRPDLHIHLDFDKRFVTIPIIEYTVHLGTKNPWPATVTDFTVVDPRGLTETPLAAKLSPFNPAINMRLYKNVDIHSADNSAGASALEGSVLPGSLGANPISDTLPDWVIARMGKGGVDLPSFTTHSSCAQPL